MSKSKKYSKRNSLFAGTYAAMVLGYNESVCRTADQKKRDNNYKKVKALNEILGRRMNRVTAE